MAIPVDTLNKIPTNGHFPRDRQEIQNLLTEEPLTLGYRPTLPLWALFTSDTVPQFYLLRDVELMMIHPIVRSALEYYKGGIAGAEFWGGPNPTNPKDEQGLPVCPANPDVTAFVLQQCQRFWDRGVPLLQAGYEYGWIAGENLYAGEGGQLLWDSLLQFSPRDVYLLTEQTKMVGVRVKQIAANREQQTGNATSTGMVDLWLASRDVPGKALWYAHNPRYNQFYGQSQLLGAWKPWRRLAWKDGAESNIDLGFYRHWCRGPIVKYPNEDFQVGVNAPAVATSYDSQGRPRRTARDVARQIAEWYKAGAGVGFPSDKYPPDMGGGDKWDLDLPDSTLDVTGGLTYAKHLWDQIRYGIGVAPELMEAAESGGGFNGRMVPLYAFLEQQQRIADALLLLFVKQVLNPLVRWNFGAVPWSVQVKPLLMTRFRGQKGEASQPASPTGQPATGPRGGERATPDFPALPGPIGEERMPQVAGYSLSLLDDRVALAREIVRRILQAGQAA